MNQKGLAPLLIVVLITLSLSGYLIYQKQSQPKTVINPQGYSGPPPEKVTVLKPNDNCIDDKKLCNLLEDITKNVQKGDYAPLINQQKSIEMTCIAGSMSASLCEGVRDGEKRSGYAVGTQYSEFQVLPRIQYIQRLNEHFKSYDPLLYEETIIATNRASIVLSSNKTRQIFLIFNLAKNENDWQITDIVLADSKIYLKTYYPTLK